MTKRNLLICLLTLTICVGMTSCAKQKGCTDPDSPRFSADAEKDDGTCESISDVFTGTWSVTETVSNDPSSQAAFNADITKVDDNTVTITSEDRTSPPYYAVSPIEVDATWQQKTIEGTSNNSTLANKIEGDISTENQFEISYEVWSLVGVDTVYLNFSR